MDFKDTYGVLKIVAAPKPEKIDSSLGAPVLYLAYEQVKHLKEVLKSLGANKFLRDPNFTKTPELL